MIKLVLFVRKLHFVSAKIAIYDLRDNLLYKGTKTDFLEKNILRDYTVATFWASQDSIIINAKQ